MFEFRRHARCTVGKTRDFRDQKVNKPTAVFEAIGDWRVRFVESLASRGTVRL